MYLPQCVSYETVACFRQPGVTKNVLACCFSFVLCIATGRCPHVYYQERLLDRFELIFATPSNHLLMHFHQHADTRRNCTRCAMYPRPTLHKPRSMLFANMACSMTTNAGMPTNLYFHQNADPRCLQSHLSNYLLMYFHQHADTRRKFTRCGMYPHSSNATQSSKYAVCKHCWHHDDKCGCAFKLARISTSMSTPGAYKVLHCFHQDVDPNK